MLRTTWSLGLLCAMIFLASPALVTAEGYRIRLQNGQDLFVSRYWPNGNQLMLETGSGVLGLPRDSIQEIQPTPGSSHSTPAQSMSPAGEREPQRAQIAPSTPPKAPLGEANRSETITKAPDASHERGAGFGLEGYRKRQEALKAQFDSAYAHYLEASGHKDPEAKEHARQEMARVSGQFYDLADEVKQHNKGVLPAWWDK